MDPITKLREDQAAKVAENRTLLDKANAENRDLNEDEKKAYAANLTTIENLGERIKREQETADLEARMEMPTRSAVKPGGKAPAYIKKIGDDEMALTERWLRRGEDAVARELRASNNTDMNIGTAADGGVLVPVSLHNQIIARRDEETLHTRVGVTRFSGMGTSLDVPVDNEADGEFVATNEAADMDVDAPALAKVTLTKVGYTKQIQISFDLLEDEGSNLMQFLPEWVGRGAAKTYNSLFITETLANGTASLTLDSATAIGAAEIPELAYKQFSEYAEGSAWIMKRATEGYIRGLASANQFLFNPTPAGSDRGTPEIWGYPVYNTEKMTGIQASAKSLIFGNFRYMGMYEDPTMTFIRDPYSLAYKRQLRLLYYFRVDFGVLQGEAIHFATHPTA